MRDRCGVRLRLRLTKHGTEEAKEGERQCRDDRDDDHADAARTRSPHGVSWELEARCTYAGLCAALRPLPCG
jgi:hypothetical protein